MLKREKKESAIAKSNTDGSYVNPACMCNFVIINNRLESGRVVEDIVNYR